MTRPPAATPTANSTQIPTLAGRDLLPHLGKIRRNTPVFLQEMGRLHGDQIRILLGSVEVRFINHPDLIKRVLQENNHNYSKDTIQYNTLASITGRGLLTSDGESWLQHRRMAQPAFSRPRLAGLDAVIRPAVQRTLDDWSQAPGGIIDVDREMMRLTLAIVGQSLFSIDLTREAAQLTEAVLTCLDHVVFRAQNPFYPPNGFPTPRNRKFKAALRRLDQAVYALLDSRPADDPGQDLLAMLLRARDDAGQPLSRQQLRDEVITLLIAGHETVASALTWTFYLLSRNPAAWEKLAGEVQTVLGERAPETADLPNLPYTAWVFQEGLRLYPPAWLITRKAVAKDELNGAEIQPGTTVVISPYAIHRHPEIWPDAEAFCPERFAPEAEAGRPRFSYIPFGGGPRLCIGNNFALIEGQMILAMVAQRYRLELPPGAQVVMDPLVTLRPHGGLEMHVRPV